MKYLLLAGLLYQGSLLANTLCPINQKGDVKLPFGYEIQSKKSDKAFDLITLIPSKGNLYGGTKQVWKVHKDSSGKITKIESEISAPLQQVVQHEIDRRKFLAEEENALSNTNSDDSILPSAKDFLSLSANSINRPVKYGGIIEMAHENGNCYVKKMSDKVFDPSQKIALEQTIYNDDDCTKINKAFSSVEREILECTNADKKHKEIVARIGNSPNENLANSNSFDNSILQKGSTVNGAGGGGDSPLRMPASISMPDDKPIYLSGLLFASENQAFNLKQISQICRGQERSRVRSTSDADNSPASVRKQ